METVKDASTALGRSGLGRRQVNSIYNESAKAKNCGVEVTKNKSKRAKTSSLQLFTIYDLPDAALAHIAAHLMSNTCRALLAVALTASSSSWRKSNWKIQPSEASKIIVHSNERTWEIFGEVTFGEDKILAEKLSDEDIGGVLACVGAVYNIKLVILAHCVGITGHGLEPLRSSIHLKKIDLSFVGRRESPNLTPEPLLSVAAAIPILDSIVDNERCSLNHIQFPKIWRLEQYPMLDRFIAKYNRMMNGRSLVCSARKMVDHELITCGNRFEGESHGRPWVNRRGENFGINNFTCYTCNKHTCPDCIEDNAPDQVCEQCEQKCCERCAETLTCDNCLETSCHGCTSIARCFDCNKVTCHDCCYVHWCECCKMLRCWDCMTYVCCDHPGCGLSNCLDCAVSSSDMVQCCFECKEYCAEHLLVEHLERGQGGFCSDCNERVEQIKASKETEES